MPYININKEKKYDSAIIVGSSLSGLMTALALSYQGIKVTLLEKTQEGAGSGATLKVDGYSFNQTKIEKHLKQIVSKGNSGVQMWSSIESRLRKKAHSDPNILLRYNTRVISIDQDVESAWAETQEGQFFKGDILIGADGHRSMVRGKVAPDHPHANFAGYLVWMTSVQESEIPKNKRPVLHKEQTKIENTIGGFLLGSLVEVENEISRIGCTWYDNTQTELLYELGAVKGNFVHHSIEGSRIPEKNLNEMANQAKLHWPEPWRTITLHAIRSRNLIGVPIKEYIPVKLIHGRFALVGDAAHVPSPITAKGFNESLIDAVVLSQCTSEGLQASKASTSLEKYESLRLNKMQEMVKSGRSFSQSFGKKN